MQFKDSVGVYVEFHNNLKAKAGQRDSKSPHWEKRQSIAIRQYSLKFFHVLVPT